MVDKVVRGEQHGRQFAGEADQGPVEDRLLLGFNLLCLPPKFFGPQDGRDTPPEPLGRVAIPHLVFGILHGHMLLPWDFLLCCAGENKRKKGKEGVSSLAVIRYCCKCSLQWRKALFILRKHSVIVGPVKWKSNVILMVLNVITDSPCLRLALVLVSLT